MFHFYHQLERADCGIACIRMIAKSYGLNISHQYLNEIADLSRLGMSIGDMLRCLELIGFECYSVRAKAVNLVDMPLPAVLYWNNSHFVVLYKVSHNGKKFHIADPEQGKITYSKDDMENFWIQSSKDTGVAVICDINDGFSTKALGKGSEWRDFIKYIGLYIKNHMRSLSLTVALSIALLILDLSIPILLKNTIDIGIEMKDNRLIVVLLLSQLAALVGGILISNAITFLLAKTGLKINLNMISDFLVKLSRFPLSFFDKRVSADFVQKMSDQSRIRDFITSFPNQVLITFTTLLIFSTLLFYYNSSIFCVFLIFSLIEIAWIALFLKRKRAIDYAYYVDSAINHNHAYELSSGMADLKVNNGEIKEKGSHNQLLTNGVIYPELVKNQLK